MTLESDLANRVLELHPSAAARALEQLAPEAVAGFLADAEPAAGAGALQRMAPRAAGSVLAALEPRRAGEIVAEMPLDIAAVCLRCTDESTRNAILVALPNRRARTLATVLRFPERTAGSLMDPEVLALPQDLTVRETLARVRDSAQHARYNVYVIDRSHVLVGAINLRELLLASPGATLSACMRTPVRKLPASADRHTIVSDPGWREVHALPVVDERGVYLGALRYRTLRALEEELRGKESESGVTARALGDLFRAGAAGMLEAVAASPTAGADRSSPGRRPEHGS